jgi:uncharacterized protein (DUF1684 family)
MNRRAAILLAAALLAGAVGCGREGVAPPAAAALDPIAQINSDRARKAAFFRDSPQSPFRADPPVPFAPLKYYPADPGWIYRSKLELESSSRVVAIRDTTGQQREATIFGRVSFTREGRTHSLTVYRMAGPAPGTVHYSLWFTDLTTGKETYEVGRYLDFQKDEDPDFVYTLDFNRAYNPYCAYSPAFSCPIPRKEDHLDLAVTAGEKKWRE